MSNFAELQKFLKNKNTSINKNKLNKSTLLSDLSFLISDTYFLKLEENIDYSREFLFLSIYYGLLTQSMTLEKIGELNSKKLTRERVRQIIDDGVFLLKENNYNYNQIENYENPFIKSLNRINDILIQNKTAYVRFSYLITLDYFIDFKKNPKGLIAFLNDCGLRQLTYRGDYFFYTNSISKDILIKQIQEENKILRKTKTLHNIDKKSKTVTYIPDFLKTYLNDLSKEQNIGLNNLYENIFNDFIENHPYEDLQYAFPKNKTVAYNINYDEWEQIGIYIDKDIYDKIKHLVDKLKRNKRYVSLMSFLAQALIWHYNKNKV